MKNTILRILSLSLILAMLLSFAACGGQNNSGPSDTGADQTDTPTEVPADTDDGEDEKDDSKYVQARPIELSLKNTLIKYSSPAIPANVGEKIDLSIYSIENKLGGIAQSEYISWSSEDITLEGSSVTPDARGVYKLCAEESGRKHYIYLVVKEQDDEEYVLYFNDFDSEDSLSELEIISATDAAALSVKDGQLTLDASADESQSLFVLLPEWLGAFGDYTITAPATITEKANESRWLSVAFRVQPSQNAYYQMCVRAASSASNGVEIAHRTPSDSWEYFSKTSHSADLCPTEPSVLSIRVCASAAEAYINGEARGSGYSLSHYKSGRVGLQVNGAEALFESVKVTLAIDDASNIALEPTVVDRIDAAHELENIALDPPDVALMCLDGELNVTDRDGEILLSVNEAIEALDGKIIPAFVLPDYELCDFDALCALFESLELSDIMIVSDDARTIRAMRERDQSLLAIFDTSEWNWDEHELIDARSAANSAGARICILPSEMAKQTNVEFFNTLNVAVWCETLDASAEEALRLITSGANAVIAHDHSLVKAYLSSSLFEKGSLLRPVGIIGHRGMPAYAPENTIAGSQLAAEYGANIIENDIYITRDGVIVVMHDSTIDRTTNGSGNVEDFTYEELCAFAVDDMPDTAANLHGAVRDPQPIPTLEEYIKLFDGTDTFLFIEIKSSSVDRIVPALKEMLDRYDFYDQCSVICFSSSTLIKVKELIPEISVGFLCSTSDISDILHNTNSSSSSYNPSSHCVSHSLVKFLYDRGIFTWPWTVNDTATFNSLYLMGVAGITTNHSNYAQKYMKRITTDSESYSLTAGSSVGVTVTAELYGADADSESYENDRITSSKAEMFLVSGNQTLAFDGRSITATESGEATVIFRLGFSVGGERAYVYTQPITVTVN